MLSICENIRLEAFIKSYVDTECRLSGQTSVKNGSDQVVGVPESTPLDLTVPERKRSVDADPLDRVRCKRLKSHAETYRAKSPAVPLWHPVRATSDTKKPKKDATDWHPIPLKRRTSAVPVIATRSGIRKPNVRLASVANNPTERPQRHVLRKQLTKLLLQSATHKDVPTETTKPAPTDSVLAKDAVVPSVVVTKTKSITPQTTNPFKKTPTNNTHRSILAPTKFHSGPRAGRSSILRPSALSGFGATSSSSSRASDPPSQKMGACQIQSSSKPAFKLKPSVLSAHNSITSSSSATQSSNVSKKLKGSDEEDDVTSPTSPADAKSEPESTSISSSSNSLPAEVVAVVSSSSETKDVFDVPVSTTECPAAISSSTTSKIGASPSAEAEKPSSKVNGSLNSDASTSSSKAKPAFIFGQNLHSKVMGVDEADSSGCQTTTNGDSSSANLFTGGAVASGDGAESSWPVNNSGKSLSESSRELTEREASQKRKYEEVEVVTGEESECNVLQMMCKLYGWGSNCWHERGRGHLRLNDRMVDKELFSRLVVRTQGTLTIMVNTKVWAEMSVEKVSEKTIRFTACDTEGQPKIYLVMGAPKDISKLYNSLQCRLLETRARAKTGEDSSNEETVK